MTLDRHSWGFRREMTIDDVLSTHDLISQLAGTVRYPATQNKAVSDLPTKRMFDRATGSDLGPVS